ncbi:hypothetical protein [Sphingomonas oryzagri]
MTGMTIIRGTTTDAVSALIAGLEREFGSDAGRALADRFLAAEDTDFCWEARVEERFLGGYDSIDEEEFELDRVAIIGQLDGAWFTGICIVDGEGHAHGMISQRHFGSAKAARRAWVHVH